MLGIIGSIEMKNEENQMDFLGHVVNLEDAQNVKLPTDEKTLSDNELEQAGLVKTSAFVRSNRSKNALRIEKHKEKKAESGIKQLNIEVPEQYRDTLKAIASELKDGKTLEEAIKTADGNLFQAKPGHKDKKPPQNDSESIKKKTSNNVIAYGEKVAEIKAQGGLKAFILNIII